MNRPSEGKVTTLFRYEKSVFGLCSDRVFTEIPFSLRAHKLRIEQCFEGVVVTSADTINRQAPPLLTHNNNNNIIYGVLSTLVKHQHRCTNKKTNRSARTFASSSKRTAWIRSSCFGPPTRSALPRSTQESTTRRRTYWGPSHAERRRCPRRPYLRALQSWKAAPTSTALRRYMYVHACMFV